MDKTNKEASLILIRIKEKILEINQSILLTGVRLIGTIFNHFQMEYKVSKFPCVCCECEALPNLVLFVLPEKWMPPVGVTDFVSPKLVFPYFLNFVLKEFLQYVSLSLKNNLQRAPYAPATLPGALPS